jgi:hypothetical protein
MVEVMAEVMVVYLVDTMVLKKVVLLVSLLV